MDQIVSAILQLFKDAQTAAIAGRPIKSIKSWYYGDPILVPASNLPAIIVQPTSGEVASRGTQYDQSNFIITIKYVANIRDTLGDSNINTVAMIKNGVILFTELDTDQKYKSDSLVGILRKNINLYISGINKATWNGNYSINSEFVQLQNGDIAFAMTMTIQVQLINSR